MKGLFQQGLAVLFETAPSVSAVENALAYFDPEPLPQPKVPNWPMGDEGVRLAFRPEVAGVVDVDVVRNPWPDVLDDMTADPAVFSAHSVGAFGPFASPYALVRAADFSTHETKRFGVPPVHTAFVRVRVRYLRRVEKEDTAPVDELKFCDLVVAELLRLEGAIALFNPNGDMMVSPARFGEMLREGRSDPRRMLDLWVNVRGLRTEASHDKLLFDTIGMAQLDLSDHEAWFAEKDVEPRQVAGFLRAMCDIERERGPVMKTGELARGPAGGWKVTVGRSSWGMPRPIRRWDHVGG